MTKIAEINEAEWAAWLAEHEEVRELAGRYPPDRLYQMQSTQQICTIASYSKDGTVRVNILPEFNFCVFPLQVYGVEATDLLECDIPEKTCPRVVWLESQR